MADNHKRSRLYRFLAIGTLLLVYVGLEYYLHIVHGVSRVYPHLFYFPIIIAALWWGLKGGFLVSLFFGLMHVLFYLPGNIEITLPRVLMFALVGSVVGIIASRIKRAENALLAERIKELTQANILIQETDRLKSQFLANMSHELRTPLTSIQGFSEILLTRDNISPEEKNKFLSYINKHAASLCKIISDLLYISWIESGRGFTMNKVHCKFGEALRKIIPYFQGQSEKHEFEVILPKEDVELLVDKDKMEQVSKNILTNALKYSPDGSLIRITGELLEDHYRISVEDQGIGMSAEQVDKIFDKFYRADAFDSAIVGTGLGMSIVRYIVEAHDGKIWVESEIGKGTKVTFAIPI